MVGHDKIRIGVLGLGSLLSFGCASFRDEARSPSRADTESKPVRSIFNWRQAQANQPKTLSITETKPEKSTAPGSSLMAGVPSSGSKFSPLIVSKSSPTTSRALFDGNARKSESGMLGQSSQDADLPILDKPLGRPIPKARSATSDLATNSPAAPKPLDMSGSRSGQSAEPTRFPTMKSAASGTKSADNDTVVYDLPPGAVLRPAGSKTTEPSIPKNLDTKPSVKEDATDLPALDRSLTPPSPTSAKPQNNQIDKPAPVFANPPRAEAPARIEKPDVALASATTANNSPRPIIDETAKRNMAEKVAAAQPVTAPASVAQTVATPAAFEVDRVAFCTQVLGFGEIERMPAENLTPGRPVLVYCEVRNFASTMKDGMYETSLLSQLTLENAQGATAARFDFDPIVDRCLTKRTDFYCHYTFALPKSIPPGSYLLRLKAKDLAAGKQAETTMRFEVVGSAGAVK